MNVRFFSRKDIRRVQAVNRLSTSANRKTDLTGTNTTGAFNCFKSYGMLEQVNKCKYMKST